MAKGTGALSTKCTLKIDNSIFFNYNIYLVKYNKKPPSSRGLGHLPFTEGTGVRLPLGTPIIKLAQSFRDSFKHAKITFFKFPTKNL